MTSTAEPTPLDELDAPQQFAERWGLSDVYEYYELTGDQLAELDDEWSHLPLRERRYDEHIAGRLRRPYARVRRGAFRWRPIGSGGTDMADYRRSAVHYRRCLTRFGRAMDRLDSKHVLPPDDPIDVAHRGRAPFPGTDPDAWWLQPREMSFGCVQRQDVRAVALESAGVDEVAVAAADPEPETADETTPAAKDSRPPPSAVMVSALVCCLAAAPGAPSRAAVEQL